MKINDLVKEYQQLDSKDQITFINTIRWNQKQKSQEELKEEVYQLEKEFAGKYYRDIEGNCYKILNFRNERNRYNPFALICPISSNFKFSPCVHMVFQVGDDFLGDYDYQGIRVDKISLFIAPMSSKKVSANYTQITKEEFDNALRAFTENLIKEGGARCMPSSCLD